MKTSNKFSQIFVMHSQKSIERIWSKLLSCIYQPFCWRYRKISSCKSNKKITICDVSFIPLSYLEKKSPRSFLCRISGISSAFGQIHPNSLFLTLLSAFLIDFRDYISVITSPFSEHVIILITLVGRGTDFKVFFYFLKRKMSLYFKIFGWVVMINLIFYLSMFTYEDSSTTIAVSKSPTVYIGFSRFSVYIKASKIGIFLFFGTILYRISYE